jgi:L-lactate dehydrogenase (cytochrome)
MASTKDWFETIEEARRRAKKRLPKSVYMALWAGAEQGLTLADNVAAFGELGFQPRIGDLPRERNQATRVLGQDISLPVIISPTGVQAVSPEGEVEVARAAAAEGTAMGLSSFASRSIEDVIAANPKTLFQMYWCGDKDSILARAERARKAGAQGLIITLDWTFAHRRDWGSPAIPEKLDFKAMLKFAPEGIVRPGYLLKWLRAGRLPDPTVPNMVLPGEKAPGFFEAYGQWMFTPQPTWEELGWLRSEWDGPFMIKGIMHPDDARRAVDIGASAISVSNHGGNNLDSTPASVRALPGIVDAVGDQIEVLMDGGIRRGSDVVKALALGAKAVMIGRAYLWAVAAAGEMGVANALGVLRAGIDEALLGLSKNSVHELSRDDLLIPPDFTRGLA